MTKNLETELERELEEARKVVENYGSPNQTKVKGMVLNNFHQYLPGHMFRVAIEKRQDEQDIPIREAEKRFYERCGWKYTEDNTSSEKYLLTTFRQYFQDIDNALNKVCSKEEMQSLNDLAERNHRFYDERKDYSHPQPIELLGKTLVEQIDTLYRAYLILRQQGYNKTDLTA
jgi:hypothetical protein